eukprot:CAMPEP_0194183124 /NCGR_PEP_ID=MMETSP0154-20130528/29749_1 /TAXON_ID=1049557 /ORGANISM="Thalassiothrix antarctica, Strain L6-D1" /LENGTH=120 /DNA_ID=CAMNT_0038899879 /DNA_START=807 /DNA_END=1166 /DNA_ORIENTATION=+
MYYTIHQVLSQLLDIPDTGEVSAPHITGPHALNRGFQYFMKDAGVKVEDGGVGKKPAKAGLWIGTYNRSITVKGVGEYENEYVYREHIRRKQKLKEYEAMGMKHFKMDTHATQKTCMRAL